MKNSCEPLVGSAKTVLYSLYQDHFAIDADGIKEINRSVFVKGSKSP